MAPPGKLSAPHNPGIVLDLVVFAVSFFVNFFVLRTLGNVAHGLVRHAVEDPRAKLALGLFFAALLLLQPAGPVLKRWSFHQRYAFGTDSAAGCVLFCFMFVYLVMMMWLTGAAAVMIELVVNGGDNVGVLLVFAGFAWSIVSVVLVFRYFVPPKKPPRWTFLTTRAAERLGDACIYLNAIGLQLLWAGVTTSSTFTEIVTKTPIGRPGGISDIVGRLVAVSACAALLYFPARIFYLVEDRHRAVTLTTMLLANLPLILRVVTAPP